MHAIKPKQNADIIKQPTNSGSVTSLARIVTPVRCNCAPSIARVALTWHMAVMPTRLIFIGNPGNGKSTLLNILCNSPHFKGGYSVGTGLTTDTAELTVGDLTYVDTPGLNDADPAKHAKACEEITKALKNGSDYKVIFFVGDNNGRVMAADVATMNMVTDAAPEITRNKFGIIVNMTCP